MMPSYVKTKYTVWYLDTANGLQVKVGTTYMTGPDERATLVGLWVKSGIWLSEDSWVAPSRVIGATFEIVTE